MPPKAPKTCLSVAANMAVDVKAIFDRLKQNFTGLSSPISVLDDFVYCKNMHVESIGLKHVDSCRICIRDDETSIDIYIEGARAFHRFQEIVAEDLEENSELPAEEMTVKSARLATIMMDCIAHASKTQALLRGSQPVAGRASEIAKAAQSQLLEARNKFYESCARNAKTSRVEWLEQADPGALAETPAEIPASLETWKRNRMAK